MGLVRHVRGEVSKEHLIVPTNKRLPYVDLELRDRLKELTKTPDALCAWYKTLPKSRRSAVCTQLDMWSREWSDGGPRYTWVTVSILTADPDIQIRRTTLFRVAQAVLESPYTLGEDKAAAAAERRRLWTWQPPASLVLPPRDKSRE